MPQHKIQHMCGCNNASNTTPDIAQHRLPRQQSKNTIYHNNKDRAQTTTTQSAYHNSAAIIKYKRQLPMKVSATRNAQHKYPSYTANKKHSSKRRAARYCNVHDKHYKGRKSLRITKDKYNTTNYITSLSSSPRISKRKSGA